MTDFELLLQDDIFQCLTEKEKTIFRNYCSILKFDEESLLFKNESKLLYVYYILKGNVKLKDNKRVFHLLSSGEFLGLNFLYNHAPVMFSAYATEGSTIVEIESSILKSFIAVNPIFLNEIFSRSGDYYQNLITNLLDFRSKKLNGAFASFLLYYNEKDSLSNLTRKEIGEILNYSRENITKVIKTFVDEGLIAEHDKCFEIVDFDGLQRLKRIG